MVDLLTFDPDALDAFYEHRWGNYACEICHNSAWIGVRSIDFPWAGIPAIDTKGVMGGRFWPAVTIACSTCGNIKQIGLDVIASWQTTEEGQQAIAAVRASKAPLGDAS